MAEEFKERRDYLYKAIAQIPGFTCSQPDGAFYLFPSVEGTGMDGHQMAKLLLEEAGVAAVGGGSFGKNGKNNIRFSYANSMANLEKAAANIEKVMNERS